MLAKSAWCLSLLPNVGVLSADSTLGAALSGRISVMTQVFYFRAIQHGNHMRQLVTRELNVYFFSF